MYPVFPIAIFSQAQAMQIYSRHSARWVCAFVALAFAFVVPVQGQVIEEGYPTKPVFPEEPPAAPHLHEECGLFLDSDAFAEECAGDNGGPGVIGVGAEGPVSSDVSLDPAWRTPPRLECPSAVFLDELETGAIDCHASDAAGEEHLDYRWEPIGGATRDYLENPRLIPEDAPNPLVVAPSSPQYEALETFLSEEGTQRYRYRLTATSRATGLSSRAEVEVFVLSSRPEVYCPLEVTVEEGSTVALACEGADPLSFRMEDGPGDAPVLWEWEGLWGASTAPLTAADTPQPLFTAPPGSAGATYHYVASMTTHSSGVSRTARRRVSVAVKAADGNSAPSITCPGDPYEEYEASPDFMFNCMASDVPAGATYGWTGDDVANRLANRNALDATFRVPGNIPGGSEGNYTQTYEYTVTMLDGSAVAATADVSVTVREKPDIESCLNSSIRRVDEGGNTIPLEGCIDEPTGAPGGPSAYRYEWRIRPGTPTPPDALSRLNRTDIRIPEFTSPADVQQDVLYQYELIISAENADPFVFRIDVAVRDLDAGRFNLACSQSKFSAIPEENANTEITLGCDAPGVSPSAVPVWKWTARDPTPNTNRLSDPNIQNPRFKVHTEAEFRTAARGERSILFYYTVSVAADGQSQSQDVSVEVTDPNTIRAGCTRTRARFFDGDPWDTIGNCMFIHGRDKDVSFQFRSVWTGKSTTDTRFVDKLDELLSATDVHAPLFKVPENVDKDETYYYEVVILDSRNRRVRNLPVTVEVRDRNPLVPLSLSCTKDVAVYEGEDVTLDCEASGLADDTGYSYAWSHPDPLILARLIRGQDGPRPTFRAPPSVQQNTAYEYMLTVTAANAIPASETVRITVLPRPEVHIAVACTDPAPVYEGADDFALDCKATGAPDGASYAYRWEARGATAGISRLVAGTDGPAPTFDVPDEVEQNETFDYRLTVMAEHADPVTADVAVRVLNNATLALSCTDPAAVYEGSDDFALDCKVDGPLAASDYDYLWEGRGATTDIARLAAGTDSPTPTFAVPDDVSQTTTYEYRLTVSAEHADPATAEVEVTVLNNPRIVVSCEDKPYSAYEGSEDIAMTCSATGAPGEPDYEYLWEARGATPDIARLLAGPSDPMQRFDVPENVDANETYEYLLTATAPNADPGTEEVTVTVLNKENLALACPDNPYSTYEGSEDITLECSAAGAPEGSDYAYAWEARGATADTDLLSETKISSPAFATPDSVQQDETYEYRLTVSAENAEDAMADVTVTVLDRLPPPEPTSVGVTASISRLRFGVQSSDTQVSLDPLTDQISTSLSGPYHAGRMMLSPGDTGAEASEGPGKAVSIELVTPVTLRREGGGDAPPLALSPSWSVAASCEQLSSRSIGGLRVDVRLAESECLLLLFGGALDLVGAPSGRYSGNLDVVLRSGVGEETQSVEVEVTVVPAQRVTTIGPGGVRFAASREAPAGLTETQNVSIYPDVAYLTQDEPSGVFALSNPSQIPLEVSVSVLFGYTEATEDGRETVVEDMAVSPLGDLSEALELHPRTLILEPGERGVVRYGVREEALPEMTERGYAAFFEIASIPRQYVRSDFLPEAATEGKTGRVTMRIPGAYAPSERVSSLRAELLSLSRGASLSATFLVESGGVPFAGEVVAYDGNGRELGRRRTLVYTRSRVRVSLSRVPEDEVVFLRFSPLGSGRVSEPVSVPWNAPRPNGGT